ncbi:MAG: polyketide cyclase [Bacteroidetes bacterium]|nr:MAG: polyketide cyclase [Bacteroidota bacterium]
MAAPDYHFTTHWRVKGHIEDVARLIQHPLDLPFWWPAVYLDVQKEEQHGQSRYHLYTKGWLPYTIRWSFVRTLEDFPHRFHIRASGDLEGEGKWELRQSGEMVEVRYDWQIQANKPLFRYFSFLLKPLFSFNHHWAMRKGEESIQLELQRLRQGWSRAEAPLPPLATFPHRHFYRRRRQKLLQQG